MSSSRTNCVDRALVKWLEGADEGTYTHDVNVEWIVNLDAKSPQYPDTYAIEWRVLPKPRSGWPVFEGLVLDVSSDLDYLKSRADELRKKSRSLNHTPDFQRRTARDNNAADDTSSSDGDSNLMDINSQAFKELVARLAKGRAVHSTPSRSRTSCNESTAVSAPPEEKVSIGKSLCVDKTIYTLVANAASPGRMVRPLLRQAFSRRRLIGSSYAGQRRMVNGIPTVKPSLKKYQKMADIHAFVLRRYPHLSQASFGAIVNSFLGERPNVIQTVEYVQDSSESETE